MLHYMKLFFTIIACWAFWGNLLSQDSKNSSYYERIDSLWHITTGFQTNNAEFLVRYPNRQKVILTPATAVQQYIKMEYGVLYVKAGYTPGWANPDKSAITGQNKRTEIGVGFTLKGLDIDLSRQKARGYYIRNTKDYIPSWMPGQPYLQIPNLNTSLYSFQIGLSTRSTLPVGALYSERTRLLKNTWSFIPSFSFYWIEMHNDAPMQPGLYNNDRHRDFNLRLPMAFAMTTKSGWYAIVLGGPVVGLSLFSTELYDTNLRPSVQRSSHLALGYTSKIRAGYNGKKWYTGISAFSEQYFTTLQDVRTTRNFSGAEIHIGTRIPPFRLLKKTNHLLEKWF